MQSNKTNKSNKKFKRNGKYKYRKTKYIKNSITNHRYLIKQEFLFNYPTYTEQNLSLNTVDVLWESQLFTKYSALYQYLKVANIRVDLIAVQKNGSNPPAGYMAFIGNESLSIKYSDIPTLPYAKKIKPQGTTSVLFTRPGRNDDFNKWYNTTSNVELQRMEATIRFRFVEPFENEKGYYTVRISYDIRFDKPYIYSNNSKQPVEDEKVCTVKQSTDGKETLIDKDEEEFDKAWDELPSDNE
jgi:hypothetical protein